MPNHDVTVRNPKFILALLFSISAWGLSLVSTSLCKYVNRSPVIDWGNVTNATIITAEENDHLKLAFNDHDIGFWQWQLEEKSQSYCNSHEACPNFDNKFRSAKVFSVLVIILGGIGFFGLVFHSCGYVTAKLLNMTTFFFALSTLFAGLTLLVLRSNVCTDPSFFDYLRHFYDIYFYEGFLVDRPTVESVSCSLSTGSTLTIVATVFWFFAFIFTAGVPRMAKEDIEEGWVPRGQRGLR
mmetsp:Transcript_23998/g.70789  ORF Transcript_23998/g.70789 Transcript_23998/m.70789 type:complete len:240 (-) Transcript_23998:341-1060(-)|eukprot:CAMPEP_0113531670 /NCGR_PEP_ID=MMETSP0015_2-20120614/3624_1 /TAXON_ID=2838 /ORGANISM="Odontella" /LENGTH=239 /DNA_ID=CAMNT_0000430529 /DNA_START=139 /DNA_END=858 /DNA_ORIENTATION=- /assembly_acc=CAM_ASM_000160